MIRRWRPRAHPTIAAGWSPADRYYWLAALVAARRDLGPPHQTWRNAEAIGCPVAWLKVGDRMPRTVPLDAGAAMRMMVRMNMTNGVTP